MKKFLLVLLICLVGGNVKADWKKDMEILFLDVDAFYRLCSTEYYNYSLKFQMGAYCIGFIQGVWQMHAANRVISKNYPICAITNGDVLDRFKVLYARNTFDIGQNPRTAIMRSIDSLCPPISEEEFYQEWGLRKDIDFSKSN